MYNSPCHNMAYHRAFHFLFFNETIETNSKMKMLDIQALLSIMIFCVDFSFHCLLK